jgi:hypothetical protein
MFDNARDMKIVLAQFLNPIERFPDMFFCLSREFMKQKMYGVSCVMDALKTKNNLAKGLQIFH